VRTSVAILAAASLFLAGCGESDEDSQAEAPAPYELPQGNEPVELDPADFVAEIDNQYWPMAPGSRWVYSETDAEGTEQRVVVTVTDRKKTILGIEATVVHDRVSEGDEIVEDTFDWYAQDRWGGVWYLGEDTTEYENGKPASTEGSWEAGVDGAQAGLIIPPDPQPGMAYRQEHYAGEAEDRGRILRLDARAKVPFGSFDELLETEDTNLLEPDVVERKFYAKGVGPILAITITGGDREELLRFSSG
jgi:hypothetical protein